MAVTLVDLGVGHHIAVVHHGEGASARVEVVHLGYKETERMTLGPVEAVRLAKAIQELFPG